MGRLRVTKTYITTQKKKIHEKKKGRRKREREKGRNELPSPPPHSHPLPQIHVSIQLHFFLLESYHLRTHSSQSLHYFASAEQH